jgi:DNA-binding transcriptional LysR family regulator
MMDRLQQMSVFVAVAEERGFAAAARRLRMSPPAVTRAIAELERRLGVSLLRRSTRHVRVTEAGERYLENARRVLADADAADEGAAGSHTEARGRLAVTAPSMFGRMFVMPGIVDYLRRYPGTQVSAVFVDRTVNLLEEGFDVAIRIGTLQDSTLRARRAGEERIVVCASPEYLQQHGVPRSPRDLLKHSLIYSNAGNGFLDWRVDGKPLSVESRLEVNTNDGAIEAALRGFGLARLLSYQVARHCESGELTLVLEKHEPPPRPIHIVHREGRQASVKVRTFVDLMFERLSNDTKRV